MLTKCGKFSTDLTQYLLNVRIYCTLTIIILLFVCFKFASTTVFSIKEQFEKIFSLTSFRSYDIVHLLLFYILQIQFLSVLDFKKWNKISASPCGILKVKFRTSSRSEAPIKRFQTFTAGVFYFEPMDILYQYIFLVVM